jgi:hypothetical protein
MSLAHLQALESCPELLNKVLDFLLCHFFPLLRVGSVTNAVSLGETRLYKLCARRYARYSTNWKTSLVLNRCSQLDLKVPARDLIQKP